MTAYHQMGHNSRNLLLDSGLDAFGGAILSPVNEDESSARVIIDKVREARDDFELILDPQLYFPNSERGQLRAWRYFPSDVDTADVSSAQWWESLSLNCLEVARELGVDAVCSPAIVPKVFHEKYYALVNDTANFLHSQVVSDGIAVYQTVLLSFDALSDLSHVMSVASLISRGKIKHAYLILVSDVEPRRELVDSNAILGMMWLVHRLRASGLHVLVGFTSSDMLLWKSAGANSCATGKFFNLRRFTKSRFDEPKGRGGGALPYWFEEGLLAYCREADVLRLRDNSLLSESSRENAFSTRILDSIQQGEPWLKHSWCHYLNWFSQLESRLESSPDEGEALLKAAEMNWTKFTNDCDLLMEEVRNDGSWVRPWRIAVREFKKKKGQ